MCKIRTNTGCNCDDYRGAVRMAVHRKYLRDDREQRDSQEVFDREESASLRAQGYHDTTDEPNDGEEHLYAAGREWTL